MFAAASSKNASADTSASAKTTKSQAQEAKSDSSDTKKKTTTADSSAATSLVPVAVAPKQVLPEPSSPLVIALPANGDGSQVTGNAPGSAPAVQVSTLATALFPQTLATSALTSKPAAGFLATAVSTGASVKGAENTGSGIAGADNASQATAADASPTSSNALSDVQPQAVSTLPHSAALLQTVPVASTNEPANTKTAAADKVEDAKTVDAAAATSTGNSTDPTLLAAQQAASAIAQSVALPTPALNLESLSAGVSDIKASQAIATGKISSAASAADSIKSGAARQTAAPLKGKPAASDLRTRRTDDSSDEDQPTVAAATPFAAKVSEVMATANQASSDPKGASDAAALQQAVQASQPSGSTHSLDAIQSTAPTTQPEVQSTAVQVPADSHAMQGVSSAQLIQSMHSSEMKLGMQSAEFGNISISTSLNRQAISAQITVDHAELGKALAVHMPAIEEKLGSAYGVQARVELRDTNNPSSTNDSAYSNSGQQSKDQRQSQGNSSTSTQGAMFDRIAALTSTPTTSTAASTSRLDIRI